MTHKGIPTIGGNGFTALYAKSGNTTGTAAGYFDGKVVVQGLVGIGTNAPTEKLQIDGGNVLIKGINKFNISNIIGI